MAIYRNVHLTFWDDTKIVDDFTPEDKYFYLYLLTNPHTNLCGCYEISLKQMARETGYNEDTIKRLIERMENVHEVIKYDNPSKELLIMNWYKYNWSKSVKTLTGVENALDNVKTQDFKDYLEFIVECFRNNTPCKEYTCPMQASDTDADTVSDSDSVPETDSDNTEGKKKSGRKKTVYYPNDDKLNQAFADYVDMRKRIRKPLATEKAFTLARNKLQKLSGGDNDLAIRILEQSILNSWQGLFELKDDRGKNNGSSSRGGIDWDNV